jgi:hypothetical protein
LSHSWWPSGVGGNRIFLGVGVWCVSSMCHLASDAGGWVGERRVRSVGDHSHAFYSTMWGSWRMHHTFRGW